MKKIFALCVFLQACGASTPMQVYLDMREAACNSDVEQALSYTDRDELIKMTARKIYAQSNPATIAMATRIVDFAMIELNDDIKKGKLGKFCNSTVVLAYPKNNIIWQIPEGHTIKATFQKINGEYKIVDINIVK